MTVHLIGVVQDNFFVAACGTEEHWDAQPSTLKTVGVPGPVTCKRCMRTNTYKALSEGRNAIYATHSRNM